MSSISENPNANVRFLSEIWECTCVLFRLPGLLIIAYPAVQVSSETESDRRCDNPAQLWAERWLETFPADLWSDSICIAAVTRTRGTDRSGAAYMSQYQLKLVFHWLQNESGWICPKTVSADRKWWDRADAEGYFIQEKTYKSGRVVIPDGFGVPKGF